MHNKYTLKHLIVYLVCITLMILSLIMVINLIASNKSTNNSEKINIQKGSQVPTKDEKEIIYDKPYYNLIVENYPGGKIYKKFLDGHVEIVNE